MEISPFFIYLIFQADSIRSAAGILVFFAAAATFFTTAIHLIAANDKLHHTVAAVKPYRVISSTLLTLCILSLVFLPKTQTMVAMYGIPAIVEVAKTDAAQRLGGKSIEAVEKLLDQYINMEE